MGEGESRGWGQGGGRSKHRYGGVGGQATGSLTPQSPVCFPKLCGPSPTKQDIPAGAGGWLDSGLSPRAKAKAELPPALGWYSDLK